MELPEMQSLVKFLHDFTHQEGKDQGHPQHIIESQNAHEERQPSEQASRNNPHPSP